MTVAPAEVQLGEVRETICTWLHDVTCAVAGQSSRDRDSSREATSRREELEVEGDMTAWQWSTRMGRRWQEWQVKWDEKCCLRAGRGLDGQEVCSAVTDGLVGLGGH